MVYKSKRVWAEGFRAKADPEIAGEQFDRLASEGRLNADEVVRENTPEDAPLHDEFNWNDSEAAHLYRKHQARLLMNHLVCIPVEQPESTPVRCYFKIDPASNNYEPTREIVQSVDRSKLLIQTAYREMVSYRNKYTSILNACGAIVAADALLQKLKERA